MSKMSIKFIKKIAFPISLIFLSSGCSSGSVEKEVRKIRQEISNGVKGMESFVENLTKAEFEKRFNDSFPKDFNESSDFVVDYDALNDDVKDFIEEVNKRSNELSNIYKNSNDKDLKDLSVEIIGFGEDSEGLLFEGFIGRITKRFSLIMHHKSFIEKVGKISIKVTSDLIESSDESLKTTDNALVFMHDFYSSPKEDFFTKDDGGKLIIKENSKLDILGKVVLGERLSISEEEKAEFKSLTTLILKAKKDLTKEEKELILSSFEIDLAEGNPDGEVTADKPDENAGGEESDKTTGNAGGEVTADKPDETAGGEVTTDKPDETADSKNDTTGE